ncbi:uncharacterized protein BDZ99DRAFT_384047 [Mytilinidion resinicola]|uniref:GTP-binding protein 8 n=1 Tax=Mytilinidion resinicola TaxID=574789 RepID=A0A6A6YT31_9PEZI|nr:uncharacterized protein BDZ99DRAFT_384047 [Mytilinidion resinicola]KAF2812106.1 hypothetical protein BDZ99DRAFT_384047 [Mytilinidion resinicola]
MRCLSRASPSRPYSPRASFRTPPTKPNTQATNKQYKRKGLFILPRTGKVTVPESPIRPVSELTIRRVDASPNKSAVFNQHLNYYRDTTPPNAQQLNYAKDIFTRDVKPSFLLATHKFRELPESDVPEVAFLGRSNVGKSSLLNALFNRPNAHLANTSSKPGRTRSMNLFGIGQTSSGGVVVKQGKGKEHAKIIGKGGLVVVDMPGYGQGSRQEWGEEIIKYLCQRKQLRRAFLLVDAEHGLKPADWQILDIMRQNSVPHQIILAKADKIVKPPITLTASVLKQGENAPLKYKGIAEIRQLSEKILKEIIPQGIQGVSALGEVLACSSEKVMFRRERMGIDGIRWACLQATGREADKRGLLTNLGLTVADGEKDAQSTPRIRRINLEDVPESTSTRTVVRITRT